jgi:copper chaperone CopZ
MVQAGVQKIEGDPVKKTLSIFYESQKIKKERIKELVAELGYTPAD